MKKELLISEQDSGIYIITEDEDNQENTFFKIAKEGRSLWVTLEAMRNFEEDTLEDIINHTKGNNHEYTH